MKNLIALLSLFISVPVFSQYFTNGSVYDYSVGDTIVTSFTLYQNGFGGSNPPRDMYRVFLSKKYSQNSDTVFYGTYDVVRNIKMGNGGYSVTTTATLTNFFITNLADTIINFNLGSGKCEITRDTTYVNSCGQYCHEKHLYFPQGNGCSPFEPPIESRLFIEGIGAFYESRSLNSLPPGMGSGTTFLFASKVAKPTCGKVGPLPSGVQEWSTNQNVTRVYPNPFKGEATFESDQKGNFRISNLLGQEIRHDELGPGKKEIHMNDQPAGIYFLVFTNEGGTYFTKLIKQ